MHPAGHLEAPLGHPQGPPCGRQRPNLERHLRDHTQRPEGARREPVHVVARDALHGRRAASDAASIARHELHLHHRIADVPHPLPPRRRDARGDHTAHRRLVRRVDGPFLGALPERGREDVDPRARAHHRDHLRGVVPDDAVELSGPELRVDLRGVAAVGMGPTADDHDGAACPGRLPEGGRRLLGRVRMDQIHEPSGRAAASALASPEPAAATAKSPHRAPSGSTFPGFMRPSGSNAVRTHA